MESNPKAVLRVHRIIGQSYESCFVFVGQRGISIVAICKILLLASTQDRIRRLHDTWGRRSIASCANAKTQQDRKKEEDSCTRHKRIIYDHHDSMASRMVF